MIGDIRIYILLLLLLLDSLSDNISLFNFFICTIAWTISQSYCEISKILYNFVHDACV